VRISDDPFGVTERVEEDTIETECINPTQENAGNHKEKHTTRYDRKQKKASIATGSKSGEKNEWKKLEADCEGEKCGGSYKVSALVEDEQAEEGHHDKYAHLPPKEVEHKREGGKCEGNEEKLNR
jgi:hypothetical protein